jgi:hypothetical protein
MLPEQALSLILDIDRHMGDGRCVLAGVVSAEQQLARGHHHADVRLSTAAVAAVSCSQGLGRRRVHRTM